MLPTKRGFGKQNHSWGYKDLFCYNIRIWRKNIHLFRTACQCKWQQSPALCSTVTRATLYVVCPSWLSVCRKCFYSKRNQILHSTRTVSILLLLAIHYVPCWLFHPLFLLMFFMPMEMQLVSFASSLDLVAMAFGHRNNSCWRFLVMMMTMMMSLDNILRNCSLCNMCILESALGFEQIGIAWNTLLQFYVVR